MNVNPKNQSMDTTIAAMTGYLQNELSYIEQQAYQVEYPELMYTRLIPFDQAPSGSQYIEYDVIDEAGEIGLISGKSKDLPSVSVGRTRFQRKKLVYGNKAEWSYDELLSSYYANLRGINQSVESQLGEAARNAFERGMNRVSLFGEKEMSLAEFSGLFNNQMIGAFVNGKGNMPVVADKDGKVSTWQGAIDSALTIADPGNREAALKAVAKAIKIQLDYMSGQIEVQTNKIERPNTLLVPVHILQLLNNTTFGANEVSILKYILENSLYFNSKESIISLNELSYKNAQIVSGREYPFVDVENTQNMRSSYLGQNYVLKTSDTESDAIFMYDRNPRKLKFWNVDAWKIMPVQREDLIFKFATHGSTCGTIVYYPASAAMCFGI